jgi:hypothetical protein
MVESKLDIILNFIKKGTGAKDAGKEVKKLEESTKGATKQTKGFNLAQAAAKLGLAAMTVQLLRQVPQLVNLGFRYKNAQIALAAYAGSAETATAITDAVSDAAGGALSKFAAVTNATRLLSLGLATTADEAALMTKTAITLGATMGKDVQGAFEEFTLLLANQSILRLDTYGISGAKVREEMARLAAVFPEMDRNARFTNATMTIAAEKMTQLEEAGFEATSSMDRLGATWENVKLIGADFLAKNLLPVTDGLFGMADEAKKANIRFAESVDTFEAYKIVLEEVGEGLNILERFALNTGELSEAQFEAAKSAQALAAAGEDLTVVQEEVALTIGGINVLLQEQDFLSKSLSLAMGGTLTKATEKWQESLDAVAASGGKTAEQQQDLINKSNELRASLEQTTAELIFQAASVDLDAQTALLLARELGLVDEATFAVAQQAQRLRIVFEETDQSAEDFAASVGILNETVNALTSKGIEITVDTLQAEQNIANLLQSINNLSGGTVTTGPGLQEGGQFQIPDTGPMGDRHPVSFMAERGETVTITPRDGGEPSAGNVSITNHISSDIDLAFFQQFLEEIVA